MEEIVQQPEVDVEKLMKDNEELKKALVRAVEAKNQMYVAYVGRGHTISELSSQVAKLETTLLALTNPKGFEQMKKQMEETKAASETQPPVEGVEA